MDHLAAQRSVSGYTPKKPELDRGNFSIFTYLLTYVILSVNFIEQVNCEKKHRDRRYLITDTLPERIAGSRLCAKYPNRIC